MDFYKIVEKSRKGEIEIYPDFQNTHVKDLLVRGKSFYAIWDQEAGIWSQDELDVQRIIDADLWAYAEKFREERHYDGYIAVKTLSSDSTGSWTKFQNYVKRFPDSNVRLDEKLTFANTEIKQNDYVSKRLGYSLEDGDYSAWDELVGTLYSEKEREKIEWAIGAVVSGDSKKIQKFCVFYGDPGSGKGTIIDIIGKLFKGYSVAFKAKTLGQSGNQFATEVFKSNPLVALDYDSDLSRIEDNTLINSIVSHEPIVINEKNKPQYNSRLNCFMFLGSNSPVKITDAKSGVMRRLIDITPCGKHINIRRYNALIGQIDFQLGAIAKHCLDVYRSLGKHYYDSYRPQRMIERTDAFYNFVEAKQDELNQDENGISLTRAYDIYKAFCKEAMYEHVKMRHLFKEELKNYYERFDDVAVIDGRRVRSWFSGFRHDKFEAPVLKKEVKALPLVIDEKESKLDIWLADCPAQYSTEDGKPLLAWSMVDTLLKDLDTSLVHYVRVPKNHIVIDFDLKNEKGEKDVLLNLEAASKWPPTYAEFSKGGCGVHLHYIYDGDPNNLAVLYAKDIEIKVFRGKAALRRRVSACNNLPLAHLAEGSLPLREEKMIDTTKLNDELHLRNLIKKCLRKGNHGATRPEIDLISKALEEAYESDMSYDVSDMEHDILSFAMNSTHQSDYCFKAVAKMKFMSKDRAIENANKVIYSEEPHLNVYLIDAPLKKVLKQLDLNADDIVFFDCEVFPNLFVICWKPIGTKEIRREINPSPSVVEKLMSFKLVGFNCRKYDNHMLYACYMGYTNEQLFDLSQSIIEGSRDAFFPEAYNISYTDIFDFCSKKQSLKKWEIELGINHKELGLKWDEPVPEELWETVAEYCDNDVLATEALWYARQDDWKARQILADIAGGLVNDTTNQLSTKFIFEGNSKPQNEFNYRNMGDLSDVSDIYDDRIRELGCDLEYTKFDSKGRPLFPGYVFDPYDAKKEKSKYRGEVIGEGGYVYSKPGIYFNTPTQDVSGMHPSSIIAEESFGERYTKRFAEIVKIRILIKHKDFDAARQMLNGALARYLEDETQAKGLASALKIVVNSVYGLTAATFPNAFRDPRNIDNIVAKRGALFMCNLRHEVERRGYTVFHCKTDSIKVANADDKIIQFIRDYGALYGYSFETEAEYERICLVNDAVYIAYEKNHGWTATGTQFQVPYVFKTLFSGEPVEFKDYCETKSVTTGGAIYLDMNESLPNVEEEEEELERRRYNSAHPDKRKKLNRAFEHLSDEELEQRIASGHDYHFIGKVGLFYPVREGAGGGIMVRENNGKYHAVTGTKDKTKAKKPYRWFEASWVKLNGLEGELDTRYHSTMAAEAIDAINVFGSYDKFVNMNWHGDFSDDVPWSVVPCGDGKWNSCEECPAREGCSVRD